jgi:hypothetical protein
MVLGDGYPLKAGASWLRNTLKPLMAKRLPNVYYAGFTQNYIPEFVKKHKITHPYFLKIDIQKFYPSVSHHALYVQTLLSYKCLLGVASVPKGFKQKLEPLYMEFIAQLPLVDYGLPLNSSISKTLAPMLYVPFFLELKKQNEYKFLVFVDDILILSKNKKASTQAYYNMYNYLRAVALHINLNKVQQGRFHAAVLDYCGWHFAGGYCTISTFKIMAFKDTIASICQNKTFVDTRLFIKKCNNTIHGFGHYYKFGNVSGLFEKLDANIRSNVKGWYKRVGRKIPTNIDLVDCGLQSLTNIKKGIKRPISSSKTFHKQLQEKLKIEKHKTELLFHYLESIHNQNKTIISLLERIDKHLV